MSGIRAFDDGKEPGALRTIGEVGSALGIKAHILRYWEEQFPQLKPLKRAGGRRLYRPEDVALIERIDALVNREGYTLKGARAALRSGAAAAEPPSVAVAGTGAEAAAAPAPALIARLKAIRADLAEALAA